MSEQERSQHSQGLRRAGQCCLVHRAIRQTLHSEGSPPAEGTRWERPSHETGIKAPKGRRVGHPEQVPNGKQHQKAGQPAPLKACTAWSSERQTSTWVLYEMGRPPWLPCSPHRTGGPPPPTHTQGHIRNAILPHSVRQEKKGRVNRLSHEKVTTSR